MRAAALMASLEVWLLHELCDASALASLPSALTCASLPSALVCGPLRPWVPLWVSGGEDDVVVGWEELAVGWEEVAVGWEEKAKWTAPSADRSRERPP